MAGGREVGEAHLTILPSARGFGNNLSRQIDGPFQQAGVRGGDRMADGVGRSGGFAAVGAKAGGLFLAAFAAVGLGQAAAAVKDFLTDAISAASDLSETQAKTGEIFGDSAKGLIDYSKTAASRLGQSQQTVLDGAATFGIFGKSAGLAGQDLVGFSTGMVELATDLASFNNTTPEQAIEAIGAALRGETEPMRAYGVLLDDATLRNRALALGLITTTKEALTPQQKVLAAHAEILAQTGTAQGDFARTSDGLANQQRILAAEMDNVKVEIGTALLPVVTDLFRTFMEVGVPALQEVATWFTENKDTIRDMVIAFVDGGLLIVQSFLGFMEHASRMADTWLTIGTNMVQTWLNVVDFLLEGAERAFGWVPGLGPKLRGANAAFDEFRGRVDEQFTAMRDAADKTTQMFQAGQDAVQGLRDKVRALNGTTATVFLNAQGNLTRVMGDGSFRVGNSPIEGRAVGGPVRAGQAYIVGEHEPELFVADRPGHIYNQSQISAVAAQGAGFPRVVTLVDRTGSILTHAEAIADRAVGAYELGGRDLSSARGLRWIAKGR